MRDYMKRFMAKLPDDEEQDEDEGAEEDEADWCKSAEQD
jgi:hypothetical protein